MGISSFTRTFLLIFSGPLVWACHFLSVYSLAALACARGFAGVEWLGKGVTQWGISALTAAAVAAIATVLVTGQRARKYSLFEQRATLGLGLLSILGIVWETLPAFLVPPCG
ncbi:hypothetical protein [Noviherbaspirillum sp. ST9]|uniref:hypothetical protein n=1 Tax=Noviherbaspirillum sp. ST9 TaxID=3401606 RepID=UPI003B58771B